MLYAEKGNRVKCIDESQIEACVAQGYTILNDAGQVIRETIPTGAAELKLAYTKHEETIKELTAKITALEAELKLYKAHATTTTDADSAPKRRTKKADPVAETVAE